MEPTKARWDIEHLRQHLQYAVDLEFWTVPFYMSAMYSIKDRTSKAFQLIQTVVNQEMLHMQSAANVANAFGCSPEFAAPQYGGEKIPHLDFSGDDPDEVKKFSPYSTRIGPLDAEHINAMCLIEIPESDTGEPPELNEDVTAYGSIGQFYQAVRFGATQLRQHLRGGIRQVDFFSAYYRNAPALTVSSNGTEGFDQAALLIDLITDQGEGVRKAPEIATPFRNTADDIRPDEDHFDKFLGIKNCGPLPDVYPVKSVEEYTEHDKKLEAILIHNFTGLRHALEATFKGENPENFFPLMASVGGNIRNCWKHGITPKFS